MRRLSLVALLVGWLLAIAPVAPVTAAGVRLQATAGFDQMARVNAWAPVRVALENDGPDVTTVVRVRGVGGQGTVSQMVELPTGVRKEVTLLLLADGLLAPLTVQVLVGEQVVAETRVDMTAVGPGGLLTGVLADTPEAGARVVAGLGNRGGDRQTARLTVADLPANPYGLMALDALVINGVGSQSLSPAQVTALREWVALGGVLVLGGGSGAPATLAGLDEIAPARLNGPTTTVTSLPGLETLTRSPVEAPGPFVVARVTPAPAAAVLAAQDDLPLVVTRPHGAGRVTFVALDLGVDPFLGWTGGARLWEEMAPINPDRPMASAPLEAAARLRWTLGGGTALDLPATGLLALLLLGYIVVIGPANYLLLRRFDRREWAWATTPLITLLFTGGVFLVGSSGRGSQVVINSINIVRSTGSASASVESHIGVFAPWRATHSLRLPAETLLVGLGDTSAWDTTQESLNIWRGGAVEARDVPFAAADFKTFAAWSATGGAELTANLRLEGDRVTGLVENASAWPLEDAVLLIGDHIHALGTLAPGASTAVDWRVPDWPARADSDLPLAARLNQGEFPTGGQNEDWSRRARFEVVQVVLGMERQPAADGFQIIGWRAEPPLPIVAVGQETRQQAVTLVHHLVTPAVQPGDLRVPPGMISYTLSRPDGRTAGRQKMPWLLFETGETIVTFSLPTTLRDLQASEVMLTIGLDEPGMGKPMPPDRSAIMPPETGTLPPGARLDIFNHATGAWDPLPAPREGVIVAPEAGRYTGADGPVRVRVSVPPGEPFMARQFDLGLRGHLP